MPNADLNSAAEGITQPEGRARVRERLEDAGHVVRDRAQDLRAQTQHYADAAGRQLEVAQHRVASTVRDKPVTTTLAVLGAALLVGAMFAARSPGALRKAVNTVRREI